MLESLVFEARSSLALASRSKQVKDVQVRINKYKYQLRAYSGYCGRMNLT